MNGQVITLKLDNNIFNLDIDNAISLVKDLSDVLDNILGSKPEQATTEADGVPERRDAKPVFCKTCQEYHPTIPAEYLFCPLCGTQYSNTPCEGFTVH